jgi:Flp pilus assembly protein TadD
MSRTPTLVLALLLSTVWLATQNQRMEAAQMSDHESHASRQSQMKLRSRTHAAATITVQSSERTPYDQTTGPALMEIRLNETFTGDLDGESPVRALQVLREDKSASLVSVQRFHGRLGGRQGTFVLQGSEVVKNGKIKATWFVVPGSGTDDLTGLRGEGGFEGDFGKGSNGTLDYWFE